MCIEQCIAMVHSCLNLCIYFCFFSSSRTFNAPSNVSDPSFLQMLWPIPNPKSKTFLKQQHHDFLPPLCNISQGICSKDVMLYENLLITYCLKPSCLLPRLFSCCFTVSVVMHHSQPLAAVMLRNLIGFYFCVC